MSVDTAAPPSKHIPPAGSLSLNLKVFGMPKGILRIVEVVLTLIAFASTASINNFSAASELTFLVAINIIAWLYTLFLIVAYIFRDKVDDCCFWLPMAEFALDGIFVILTLIAGGVAGSTSYISSFPAGQTGVAFSILAFVAFGVSTFLDFKEHKALEKHGAQSTQV